MCWIACTKTLHPPLASSKLDVKIVLLVRIGEYAMSEDDGKKLLIERIVDLKTGDHHDDAACGGDTASKFWRRESAEARIMREHLPHRGVSLEKEKECLFPSLPKAQGIQRRRI